jgi:hypothetical protein
MYNLIGRQLVLAEKGGVPNQRIALISNPLDPAIWSDALADEMNIDFAWLDSPDYSDNFVRVNERLNAAMRHHIETERPREFNRIADEVFAKYGIVDLDEPISDGELLKKLVGDPTLASPNTTLPRSGEFAFSGYARDRLSSRVDNARFFPSGMIASCVKTS